MLYHFFQPPPPPAAPKHTPFNKEIDSVNARLQFPKGSYALLLDCSSGTDCCLHVLSAYLLTHSPVCWSGHAQACCRCLVSLLLLLYSKHPSTHTHAPQSKLTHLSKCDCEGHGAGHDAPNESTSGQHQHAVVAVTQDATQGGRQGLTQQHMRQHHRISRAGQEGGGWGGTTTAWLTLCMKLSINQAAY